MEKEKLEQNQHAKPQSPITTSIFTGFFGGVFWGAIGMMANYFNFTKIRPNTMLEPWTVGDWKTSWIGTVISLLLIGGLGIIAALLYYFTLKKFQNIWVSVGYGIVLFVIVFFLLNPLFPNLDPITELDRNTIITMLCLYVLFGVFVGYSISYEYNEQIEEKRNNHST